jgi:hypothetical protein
MKREAVHHSKMKRLCRRLRIPLWQAVGLLESIWHITAREAPRGDIGKLSDENIAIAIDYHEDEHAMIAALVETGWLDRNNQHRLVVHDWPDHADDGIHMKLARGKQFFIRQDAHGETILQAPKLSRLEARERDIIRGFYSNTENITSRAYAVRTDIETVRTDSKSVRTKQRSVREALPRPSLDPASTLSSSNGSYTDLHTHTSSEMHASESGWETFTEAFLGTGRNTTAADLTNCKLEWDKLPLVDRIACVAGIRRDIEHGKYSGPTFWPKPRKYIHEREWTREPNPKPAGKQSKLLAGVFDA